MLISEKQHHANQQNAQKSCGPKTEAGREAIRFNALTFGLRTRATILPTENAAAYSQLWDELFADWNPRTRTETCCFETRCRAMAVEAATLRVTKMSRYVSQNGVFGKGHYGRGHSVAE